MSDDLQQLALQIDAGADADDEEVDELASQLRRQLLELDIDSVDRIPAGEAPPGTRGGPLLLLGGLLVTHSPEMLKMVVGVVQSWVAGHQGRTVELQLAGDKLTLTGVSSEQQQQLIALFVQRHSG
jgi:hypothetical protein